MTQKFYVISLQKLMILDKFEKRAIFNQNENRCMRISRITYGFWFNHFVFPFFLISLMLGYKDLHINWAWQFTEYLKFNKRFQSPLKFELDNWKSPLSTLELQNVPKMTHLYWAKSTVLTDIWLNSRYPNFFQASIEV